MGEDGWLGIGWPEEYGGQGRSAIEQFIFFDESMRAGAPVPMLTINTVGPTIMDFGTDEQKAEFLPRDPEGRDPLLHRLHRARRRHRPGRAHDQGRARRRRVRHQRPEDLHEPRRRRRLLLARRPHRPGGEEAQGHLDVHRPDGHARHQAHAHGPHERPRHQPGLLRRRARAGDGARRRREQRLGADHQPAQPRAGHAVLVRDASSARSPTSAGGRRRPSSPTAAASSTRSGCR